LEGRAALACDVDAAVVHDDGDDAATAGELEELGDRLGLARQVDLAEGDAGRLELGARGGAVGAAGARVEEHGGAHGTSVEAISVAAALNMPPRPWQSATVQSGTWRSPHSPRSWRTASTSVNIPYMPLCV